MKAKQMSIQKGVCPKCGSDDLEYEGSFPKDNDIHYPYSCQDCDFDGEEVYTLSFVGHINSNTKDFFEV